MPSKTAKRQRRASARKRSKSPHSAFSYISVFLLSLVAVVSIGLVGLYKYYTSELVSAMTPATYHILQDDFPTLAILEVEDLSSRELTIKNYTYALYDLDSKKLYAYSIDPKMELDYPGRVGSERVENALQVFSLGKEGYLGSPQLLRDLKNFTLKVFGFKLDKYIVADSKGYEQLYDLLLTNNSNLGPIELFALVESKPEFTTNLTLKELNKLSSFSKDLYDDRIVSQSLSDLTSFSKLDTTFKEVSLYSAVSKENLSIAILNGSQTPGVAGFVSNIVSNLGGRIVAIDNAEVKHDQSVFYADNLNSESLQYLSRTLGIDRIEERDLSSYRADIVIILGIDFVEGIY